MDQISTIILSFLSIFISVNSLEYKDLVNMTVIHTSMDQNGYELLNNTGHPFNFKLNSYVKNIPGDLYSEYQTYTATIQMPNRQPRQVYVKIVMLERRDMDLLIYGYVGNYKNLAMGVIHSCQTAMVSDIPIGYLAIETSLIKQVERPLQYPYFDYLNEAVIEDYVNKFKHPDHATPNQLKVFKLGDRIKSERKFVHCFKAQVYKVNSTKSIKAIVMFYFCPPAHMSTVYYMTDFIKEVANFQEKNPERFIRIFNQPFVNGHAVQSKSVVVIEAKESFLLFNRRSFPLSKKFVVNKP